MVELEKFDEESVEESKQLQISASEVSVGDKIMLRSREKIIKRRQKMKTQIKNLFSFTNETEPGPRTGSNTVAESPRN